jgi:hypothetical protein
MGIGQAHSFSLLLFAFGGKEGNHTLVNMNTSLLGTAGRPSLF